MKKSVEYNCLLFKQLQRQFERVGDCLHHTLYMATENTPEIQEHLCATYVKECEDTD